MSRNTFEAKGESRLTSEQIEAGIGEYKTVSDVISDLNVMIVEAPIPNSVSCKLAYIVSELEAEVEDE
jgi:hypothetical protein